MHASRLFSALIMLGLGAAGAQTVAKTDYTQGVMLKSVPLSMGGAFRAIADTNAAILYNPAGLAFLQDTISLSGEYMRVGFTDSHAFSVSAVDAKTLPGIPFAIEYDFDRPTFGTQDVTLHYLALGTGVRLGENFSMGGTIKGYLTQTNSPLVDGPDGVDVDLGVLFKPAPYVSLALTAQSLFVGSQIEEFPFVLGGGVALILDPHARLTVDVTTDLATPSAEKVNSYFGGELRLAEGIYFRSGFGLDRVRLNNFYATGLSLEGPKARLYFTFSQRLNPTTASLTGGVEFRL